jgi:hypothetical protein
MILAIEQKTDYLKVFKLTLVRRHFVGRARLLGDDPKNAANLLCFNNGALCYKAPHHGSENLERIRSIKVSSYFPS